MSKRLYINFEGKNSSFRFMPQFCLTLKAISKVGETLYISDAKGSCVKGQTSTVKTNTGSGTLVLSTYSKSHELKKILTLSFSTWTNLCFLKFIIFLSFFFRSMLWVPVFMSVKVQQYSKNCKITSKPSIVAFFFCFVRLPQSPLVFSFAFLLIRCLVQPSTSIVSSKYLVSFLCRLLT